MQRRSAIAHWVNLPTYGAPALITHGEKETSEFKRQAQAFAEVWQSQYGNCRKMEIDRVNHYEIIETLANSESQLRASVLELFFL